MSRCLTERALVRVCFGDGREEEHSHLRLCADCAESYDTLVDDLQAIDEMLAKTPPRTVAPGRPSPWRWTWIPAAAFSVAIIVGVVWLRRPAPVQMTAGNRNLSAFATDVSTALFAAVGSDDPADFGADAPSFDVTLDAGWPCTRDAFLTGECSDQVSALFIEAD